MKQFTITINETFRKQLIAFLEDPLDRTLNLTQNGFPVLIFQEEDTIAKRQTSNKDVASGD